MLGTTLSHYQVLEKLGAGGEGVVYRARDTKLGRDVAIKVLPEALSQDAERLSRFKREARLLASLNHPNVATLHGFEESSGTRFLVMELVEGETLCDRIACGPVPVAEALELFRQMAEGLEAAHEKGVVHRDLKPGNVKMTPEGKVKVLDFGLAKVSGASTASGPQSESPTVTRTPTESGVILGTAAYMSPEQARGKLLDKRTDIWSFGCCFFEALTGRAAFLGETVSDTLAKILETEPSWETIPAQTPRRIRELLERCLTKDPRMRLHDIADARIEIVKSFSEPSEALGEGWTRGKRTVLEAVAVALGAIAFWSLTRSPATTERAVTRSILPLPEDLRLARDVADRSVAISPNGRYVAMITGLGTYVAGGDRNRLWLRSLDELQARELEGADGASAPAFSPDSEWLGFARDRTLLRTAVSGGAPRRIASFDGTPRGVGWKGDEIVFSGEVSAGLFRVHKAGGEPEGLTVLDQARREKSHRFPQMLPGGDAVLFTLATSTTESWDDATIAVGSMKTGEYKIVLEGGANARYSSTGHLVFARSGALHAVTFDLERLEVTGQPVRVLEGVMTSPVGGAAEFDLAENGSLVYAPGLSRTENRQVVFIDRSGRVETLIETPRPFTALRLSADGRYVAFQVFACIDSVWVYALDRGTLTRLTSEWDNAAPVWDPSGREIAVASARAGPFNLYRLAADGAGHAERLATSDYTQLPTSWSPDGSVLAFQELRAETGADVFLVSFSGDREPKPFLNGRANELWAEFSPNGEWIAYQSDETGRFEIYVRRYPGGESPRQVSTDGGSYPVWNPNGKELFYRSGDTMMAVAVETEGGNLVMGPPAVLFEKHYGRSAFSTFAVTPDGRRFIDLDDSAAEPAPTHLVLVQNFSEELKRLAPPPK